MSLEKKSAVDKIEIVRADSIPLLQVRTSTWVEENGVKLGSPSFSRVTYTPDVDLDTIDGQVKAVAKAIFTTDVKAAYADELSAQSIVDEA